MTHLLGLAEAALYVRDVQEASAFYTQALGLPISAAFNDAVFLQTGPHNTLILFNIEGIANRHSPIPKHGAHGPGHVALAIPAAEFDAWRERLQAHQVTIEHEQTWSTGARSLYFRDPDGNSLELIEAHHYPQLWERLGGNTDAPPV